MKSLINNMNKITTTTSFESKMVLTIFSEYLAFFICFEGVLQFNRDIQSNWDQHKRYRKSKKGQLVIADVGLKDDREHKTYEEGQEHSCAYAIKQWFFNFLKHNSSF